MKDTSSYVIEEQSRGVGAIASRDLGVAAKASGEKLVAKKRSGAFIAPVVSERKFPSKSFRHKGGKLLPQPTKRVVAKVKVPKIRQPTMSFDKPKTRTVKDTLVSKPGGALVTAGVILGKPPRAIVKPPSKRPQVKKGAFSAVHTPKGPTLSKANRVKASLGQDAWSPVKQTVTLKTAEPTTERTTTTVTATKSTYSDVCRQMGIPEKYVPMCKDLLKYGIHPAAKGHTPMTPDQMLAVVGPLMQSDQTAKLATSAPQPPKTTAATVPVPTSVELAPRTGTAPVPPTVVSKTKPNWLLIGGIAGAGVALLWLLRK